MAGDPVQWLLESAEPWTRYRTLVDLLDRPEEDPEVHAARAEMLAHPRIQELIAHAGTWPGPALKRHNDASHPLYAFSTLVDFGLTARDSGMRAVADAVLAHQSSEGAFQTVIYVPESRGGRGDDAWTWMACDAPTLLYSLSAMGVDGDPRVEKAAEHLVSLADDNGWRCVTAPEYGGFRGPGRKGDPCPIANVYALKAVAQVPGMLDSREARVGAEMLLWHWEHQTGRKLYLFGIGTDFRKLKYPFLWYDILHVVDVLSRFPFVCADKRFREMVETITAQADEQGRYTATSMYRAWKRWSFADKKSPSPWLTCLVLRVLKRLKSGP